MTDRPTRAPSPRPLPSGRERRWRAASAPIDRFAYGLVAVLVAGCFGTFGFLRYMRYRATRCPYHHYPDLTRRDAITVRVAATLYLVENPGDCPTTEALVHEGYLEPYQRTRDAWGHAFVIDCSGDGIRARSAGNDGLFGTDDDIE